MQPNQYKDGKTITQTIRQLHTDGQLNEIQDRIFEPNRPPEELYDLQNDPYEIKNCADAPEYQQTLKELRNQHRQWMKETKDMGLIPEPVLEEAARRFNEHKRRYFRRTDAPEHLVCAVCGYVGHIDRSDDRRRCPSCVKKGW